MTEPANEDLPLNRDEILHSLDNRVRTIITGNVEIKLNKDGSFTIGYHLGKTGDAVEGATIPFTTNLLLTFQDIIELYQEMIRKYIGACQALGIKRLEDDDICTNYRLISTLTASHIRNDYLRPVIGPLIPALLDLAAAKSDTQEIFRNNANIYLSKLLEIAIGGQDATDLRRVTVIAKNSVRNLLLGIESSADRTSLGGLFARNIQALVDLAGQTHSIPPSLKPTVDLGELDLAA